MKNTKSIRKVSIIMGSQSDYATMKYAAKVLNSYDEKYHIYDHEFGAYIYNEKQRRNRGILYATIVIFVFIATHFWAASYFEESAGFYPPYIEKSVVYPELYKKDKASE